MKQATAKVTHTNSSPSVQPFKRLEVGTRFANKRGGQAYRKVSGREAIQLNAEGRGLVHEKIRFSRSANVVVIA